MRRPAAPGGGATGAELNGGAAMATVTGTGGGVLGQALIPLLLAEGHEVTVLTRRAEAQLPGDARRIVGDPASGAGLDAAVRDAGVVVHLATSPFRAARIDCGGTRALAEAITRRGSGLHLVYASIVGVDQIPWPYYKRKRQAEALVTGSGLPFTIQRATQFHDLVLMAMRSAARAPVLLVLAGTSCQPVDTADVAQRLAEIVRTGPLNGLAADLDGPQVLDASRHTAGDVLAVIGARRPVRPVWIPGRSVPGSGLVIISPRHAARRADMAFIPLGPLSGGARCPPAALYQRRVPIRRR